MSFVELLDAMQGSQGCSAPAMEPEKVADLLHDLADPTPVDPARHSPRGRAELARLCRRPRRRSTSALADTATPTGPHRAATGALAGLSSVPTVSDSARSDTVPDFSPRPIQA
jgi:hypothetical protein